MEFKLANGWITDEGEFLDLNPGSTHKLTIQSLKPEVRKDIEKQALSEGWVRVAYLDLNGKELGLQANDVNKIKQLIRENIREIVKAQLSHIAIEWSNGSVFYSLPECKELNKVRFAKSSV